MDIDFERHMNLALDDPELRALIDKVIAQPKHKMTPEEIDAWAKRLAADVADLTD